VLNAQLVKDRTVGYEVLFPSAGHSIPDDQTVIIEGLCSELRSRDNYSILLRGNTDSIGSYTYNLALSEQRAKAVLSYLTERGIPPDVITTEARSYTTPKASNGSEPGRSRNRRTSIVVTYHYFPVNALQPIEALAPGATFNLRVLFKFDKAEFQPGARERLDSIAHVLQGYPDLRFELLGWSAVSDTDDSLSTRRAKAVHEHLLEMGIAPERLRYRGMGGAGCMDPADYPNCRRVEIAITRNPYYDSAKDPRIPRIGKRRAVTVPPSSSTLQPP
jgi:outer membrane protein OmpA-like peptidoglycan-associated protein